MSPMVNLKVAIQNEKNDLLLPVTGKLRYPADRARPDILTSVGKISSDGHPHPSDEHYESAKQIIRYLKSTPSLSVMLGGKSISLFAYSNIEFYVKN